MTGRDNGRPVRFPGQSVKGGKNHAFRQTG